MKLFLSAIGVFFFSFFVTVIVAATGYYLYFNCLWLAAGAPADLQPLLLFLEGMFAVCGACAIFSLLPVVFYFIRRPTRSVFALISWCFLCFTVFGVLQPLSFILNENFSAFTAEYRAKNPVYIEHADTTVFTAGFFRELGDGIYYFTEVNTRRKYVTGLKLTVLSGRTSVRPAVVFNKDTVIFDEICNISDPLIADTIVFPKYAQLCIDEISALTKVGEKAFLQSDSLFSRSFFSDYVGSLSIGIAMLGFFAFTAFSSWKLLNVLFLPVCCALVLHINFLVQCGTLLAVLKNFFSFLPPDIPAGFYTVAINLLIFVLLLVCGLFGKSRKQVEVEVETE